MPREKQNFWRPDKNTREEEDTLTAEKILRSASFIPGDEKGERMPGYQITEYCHRMIRSISKKETAVWTQRPAMEMIQKFLCRLTGQTERSTHLIFKKQQVEHTKKRLEEAGLTERAKVILDGHEHMENYVRKPCQRSPLISVNLPGGDHQIATQLIQAFRQLRQGFAC